MKCEKIAEIVPDYLQGATTAEDTTQVKEHLEECSQCRAEVELWQKLGTLPTEQPGIELRARFDAMLETYQQGRWEKENLLEQRNKFLDLQAIVAWLRTPALSAAWAVVLVLCGFLAGRYLDHDSSSTKELGQVRQELKNMQQLVVISMLQQQSASERLQGVGFSMRQPDADPQILNALLHTLHYDNSVDVRLAALDVLSRYGRRQDVRKGLIDALEVQQSPLVQVALIDVLVELRDPGAVEQLKRFQENPRLDPSVRKRVNWGIQQLS
jgi:HEAT repeats/Putative zinc-finger